MSSQHTGGIEGKGGNEMARAKKGKTRSRNLKKGSKVEAVKTLKTPKMVDASSSTLFNMVSSGTHIPPAK